MAVKKKQPKNKATPSHKIYYWITGFIIFLSILFFLRSSLTMYYYIIKGKMEKREYGYHELENQRTETEFLKIQRVFQKYNSSAFGIDISQHQGDIKWDSLNILYKKTPISFIFIRATRGSFTQDAFFNRNWKKAEEKNIIRGAYHYYDVNKNSTDQANNFINTVNLKKGDLPPVLDVEELPKNQSLDLLKKGIVNWLKIIEEHYNIKPIIYSNDAYFIHHIYDLDLSNYPIWVANYNPREKPKHNNWTFWQFTEKGIVTGITQNFVDINVFKGTYTELKNLTLK